MIYWLMILDGVEKVFRSFFIMFVNVSSYPLFSAEFLK
jgi:hypothetical protein